MATTKRLIEMVNIVGCFTPVDLQTGTNNGDWVSLKHYTGVLCVLHSSIGTANDDCDMTLEQATTVAGAGAKAITMAGGVYDKLGATTIPNGVWTRTDDGDDLGTFTNADSAENAYIFAVDVQVDDLDVTGGFDCVRLTCSNVGGNAQLGSAIYIMYGPRIEGTPDAGGSTPIRMPSPLVD